MIQFVCCGLGHTGVYCVCRNPDDRIICHPSLRVGPVELRERWLDDIPRFRTKEAFHVMLQHLQSHYHFLPLLFLPTPLLSFLSSISYFFSHLYLIIILSYCWCLPLLSSLCPCYLFLSFPLPSILHNWYLFMPLIFPPCPLCLFLSSCPSYSHFYPLSPSFILSLPLL